MKKILLVLGAAAVACWLGLLPFHANDVADLIPAQTVFVMKNGAQYTVDVGAGVQAVGDTLKNALSALQEQTAGSVFFETCEQVVLMGDTESLLPEIASEESFRPAAGVYAMTSEPDAEALSEYLHTHHGGLTVGDVKAAIAEKKTVEVPTVQPVGGGFRIVA